MDARDTPPRLARRALSHLHHYGRAHLMPGDLDDEFRGRSGSRRRAVLWYWGQVLFAFVANIKRCVSSGGAMLRNHLTITLRIIRRHKLFSFINIAGLAAGIACCLLISIWVRAERSTDRFHEKIDRIFLVRSQFRSGQEVNASSGTPPLLGPALAAEFPEVLGAARLFNWQPEILMKSGDVVFRQEVLFADPALFEVFTFPIARGERPRTPFPPTDMVVSERLAARLFGREDPVGRTVTLDNRMTMTVRAVMRDVPSSSSRKFDAWAPLEAFAQFRGRPDFLDNWGNIAFRTYVELAPGVDPGTVDAKIGGRIQKAIPEADVTLTLYPFKELYLKLLGNGRRVGLFSIVAVLVLLMACINFANLSSARADRRALEVGVRKTAGAGRGYLIGQFLGEALLFAALSWVAAMGLVIALLPVYRRLTGLGVGPGDIWAAAPWPVMLGLVLSAGLLSGLYPAFVLSSLRPALTLKSDASPGRGRAAFRKALVLTQFSLSILFIIAFVVVASQVRFMQIRDPGYSRQAVLYVPIQGEMARAFPRVKSALMADPAVERVTVSTDVPFNISSVVVSGDWEGRDPEADANITFFGADHEFLTAFGLGLVQGRFFGLETPAASDDIVINERLAGLIGRRDILGSRLTMIGRDFTVIGVVKDFLFRPLDQSLGPLAMFHDEGILPYRYMFVKARPGGIPNVLAFLEGARRAFGLDAPLEPRFLDEEASAQYRNDERFRGLVGAFTALAVVISALGLIGLSAFMVERRVREIGIRKVLGASALRVTGYLTANVLKWVLAANLIAWPAGYLIMSRWLRNFAFRIDLEPWIFLLSGGALLALGLGTVAFQTLGAARAAPVDSLRHE
jgi:ABC-type antimicrobial peptide transport system permease subunit